MDKIESTGLLYDCKELRKLIIENPDLPLLVFAGEEANIGDFGYMACGKVDAILGEFLDCNHGMHENYVYTDRIDFEEYLFDYYALELNDEEIREKLKSYEPFWKKCIILYVDN